MSTARVLKSFGFTLSLLCLSAGTALADFAIAGASYGAFNSAPPSFLTSFQGLSFKGGPFESTTSPVELGTFKFNAPTNPLTAFVADFVLTLTFTEPVGSGDGEFSADVYGLASFGVGVAAINFNPNKDRIYYQNGTGTGSFDLTLNDITVWDPNFRGSGAGVKLYGIVDNWSTAAISVPEPSAIPELLLSILGIGLVALRQRRHFQNS